MVDPIVGLVGLVSAWLFLYSAVYIGVKHALRDHFGTGGVPRSEDGAVS